MAGRALAHQTEDLMPSRMFGQYEATGEIARTALGRVWRARAPGASQPAFAAKLLDCGVLSFVADDSAVAARINTFMDSVDVQTRVSAVADSRWAPIHASGRGEDSAFLVTDLLPLNVARLVEGRAAARAQVLVAVVTGIATALRQINTSQGRWHGNLRATNVFFDRDSDIESARIILLDPRASRELPADKGEVDDLRAIGQLIHQLVTHEPFESLGGWPVAPGPAWNKLGKVADGWRELCSDLLDPDLKPGVNSLDRLVERASALMPPPRPVWRYVLAGAAAIALVVSAAIGWHNRPWKPLDWDDAMWAEVCDNSDWYGALIEGALAQEVDERAKRFEGKVQGGETRKRLIGEELDALAGDPELVAAIAAFVAERSTDGMDDAAWSRFAGENPGVERADSERAMAALTDSRNRPVWMLGHSRRFAPAAKKSWTTEDPETFRTERPAVSGGDLIRAAYGLRIARFMQSELRAIVEEQQAALQEEVAKLVESGPPAPRAASEVLANADPSTVWQDSEQPIEARVRALADAGRNARELGTTWASVQQGLAALAALPGESASDGVLSSLADSVRADIAKADEAGGLDAVLQSLTGWNSAIASAARVIVPNAREIDWDELPARDGLAPLYGNARETELTPAGLVAWAAAAEDKAFWLVIEPRPAIAIETALAGARASWESIEEVERDIYAPELASFIERSSSLRRQAEEVALIRWIQRNRADIEARTAQVNADASTIADEAASLVAEIAASALAQSERWLNEDPASITSVAALSDYWAKERAEVRARVGPAVGGTPGELRAALRNLRGVLFFEEDIRTGNERAEGWSRAIEKWGGEAPEPRPEVWGSARWEEAVQDRREGIARQMLASLEGWDCVVPLPRWAGAESVESAAREAWASADAWRLNAHALAADFRRAELLRDAWYGASEQPADGGETIAAIVSKWRADQGQRLTMKACDRVVADADRLLGTATLDRAAALDLAGAEAEPAWMRFAAWRALGNPAMQPRWPVGDSELGVEIQQRGMILASLDQIDDEQRRGMVRAEIQAESGPRWSRALLSGGPDELERVMARRAEVGVTQDSAGLDPAAAVNLAMFEFATSVRRVEDEERVKAMGIEMVERVRPLLDRIDPVRTGAVAASIRGIDEIARGRDTRKTLTEILAENGPGINPAWQIASTEGAGPDGHTAPEIIRYRRPGGDRVLTFIRADLDDPEPVYLCTEEVSIGLVRDIASTVPGVRHGLTRMREWSKLESPEDRRGIFTWQLRRFTIEPWDPTYPWWNDSNVSQAEAYPEGMDPSPACTLETPVTWIEPEAAEQLAEVVGCRLPTSAEWRLALAKERSQGTDGPGANVRDSTFTRFTEHVAKLRQTQPLIVFPHAKGAYDPGDVENQPAAAATSADDGSLWFEPQSHPDRGVVFAHLIGNVGEFVDDQPGERGGYGVVGGSAMSISSDPEATKPIRTRAAFSDVGFRLAFQAKDLKPAMWAAMLKEFGPTPPYLFSVPERP